MRKLLVFIYALFAFSSFIFGQNSSSLSGQEYPRVNTQYKYTYTGRLLIGWYLEFTVSGPGNAQIVYVDEKTANITFDTEGTHLISALIIDGNSGLQAPTTLDKTVYAGNRPTRFNVTGGGNGCDGQAGVSVGLADSEANTRYKLKRDNVFYGVEIQGTGGPLDFGPQTIDGTYTVRGINDWGGRNMIGQADVMINSNPIKYNLTGGGTFCDQEVQPIILDESEGGVSYQLWRTNPITGTTPQGPAQSGTGSSINFWEPKYIRDQFLPCGRY